MPPVKGSPRAAAAVRIHSPNTTVRPSLRIELAILQILDLAAVALPASVRCSWAALNYLSQHVIQRPDKLCCLAVTAKKLNSSKRVIMRGAKCIYLGESGNQQIVGPRSIHVHARRNALEFGCSFPTNEVVQGLQNQLLFYRIGFHDAVASSKFRVTGLLDRKSTRLNS